MQIASSSTLTSPTGGGRSVGIVRVRTKATEFSFSFSTVCCNVAMWRSYEFLYFFLCVGNK